LVSRCIALPGDTIRVNNEGYRVNGILYPRSPTALSTYVLPEEIKTPFRNILKELGIPLRNMAQSAGSVSFRLTSVEEYRIREDLTERLNTLFVRKETERYTLVVPRKGATYRLDEDFLTVCKEAIRQETNNSAVFRNNKLYLNNEEARSFRFSQDYYWMLSDNIDEAVDSRHLGFIPLNHIIGNVWFCWYSADKQRFFKTIH
jgi:signal peptidase I